MASGCEGWMWKKGKVRGNYKRRFFKLQGTMLSYHESPVGKSKGTILLSEVYNFRLPMDPSKYRKAPCPQNVLELETRKRVWAIIPENTVDQHKWIDALIPNMNESSVSKPLLDAHRDREGAVAPPTRRGKRGKSRKATPDSDDEPARRGDSDNSLPGPGGSTSPRGLFGRRKQQDVEMTVTELAKSRKEVSRLQAENRRLQAELRRGGKGKGKGGALAEPLLDGSDYSDEDNDDEGPGCCSRMCFCIRKNLSLFIMLVVNVLLLAMGSALVALAYYAKTHSQQFTTAFPDLKLGLIILLAVGGALLLLAIMGILGACCRKKWWARCFLYIFALVMSVVIVVELAAAAIMFKSAGKLTSAKTQAEDAVTDAAKFTMQECCIKYSNGNGTILPGTKGPDALECRWIPTHITTPPIGYCELSSFTKSVLTALKSDVKKVAIIAVAVVVVEAFCVYASCMLAKDGKNRSRREKKSRGGRPASKRGSSKSKKSRRRVDTDESV